MGDTNLIVNYQEVFDKAGNVGSEGTILNEADKLNSEIIKIYQTMTEMHSVWFGVRYNELAKAFNGMIQPLTDVLKYVVTELPHSLKVIANNYSQSDRGMNCGAADAVTPKVIPEITIATDVGMKYQAENVATYKTNVEKMFENAVGLMNNIVAIFNSVSWGSESAESFTNNLKGNQTTINNSFESIKQTFATKMAEAAADIQKAESSSNVNG